MATVVWSALADPSRRAILDRLLDGPQPVGELARACGLSQPGTSKHLRVLREAGLVAVRQDAQRRLYAIRPAPIAELDAWLAPYRRLWNASLDALGERLDATTDTATDTADDAAAGAGARAADEQSDPNRRGDQS